MDDIEREAIRAEGYDPDDPAVVAAIDLVRWELSLSSCSYPADMGSIWPDTQAVHPKCPQSDSNRHCPDFKNSGPGFRDLGKRFAVAVILAARQGF
jgi:hypothetical protein